MTEHTSRHYEQELQELKDKLLLLGGMVEEMIGSAMRSLLDRDPDLARRVIDSDPRVDAAELEIDHHCLNLLALRQPAASDLRFIATALKIVTDLERIGDTAVNLAERSIELNEEPPLKPYIDIPRMAILSSTMLREALDAFVRHDAAAARSIVSRDDEVDNLNKQLFRELVSYMIEDPHTITRAMELILVARNLERVADLATNIAEEVVFITEARIIKHHADERVGNDFGRS